MVHVYALIPREQCRQIGWWLGEMERAHGLPKASKKLIPLPRSCSLSDLSSSGYLPNTHPPYPHPPWFHPPCSGSIIEKYFLRAGRFRICRSLKTLVQAMIWTKISAGWSQIEVEMQTFSFQVQKLLLNRRSFSTFRLKIMYNLSFYPTCDQIFMKF